MIIDCIADLHGFDPKLDGGDLLIVAGDLTARDTDEQHRDFILWLAQKQHSKNKYKKIIYIAGNHDHFLYDDSRYGQIKTDPKWGIEYLCDSGTEFEGLKIWGSPWSPYFDRVNPHCTAFMKPDKELSEIWKKIPDDTDILITHCPPFGIRDSIALPYDGKLFHAGSMTLAAEMANRENVPKLWVWGHIHEAYGEDLAIRGKECKMINCSHVNERYQPVNKPIRVIL